MLILEAAINKYLALDPEAVDSLAEFSGKVIKMKITGINKSLYLLPDGKGIQVRLDYDGDVDTTLTGSPFALFKMGLASNVTDLLLKGEIEVRGDTRLGHRFKNVFSKMDIDWSEPLSNVFGDAAAFHINQTLKEFGRWAKRSSQSVTMSLGEYLTEESRDVVTETELEIFNEAVDELRNDVDRLEAKINAKIDATRKANA